MNRETEDQYFERRHAEDIRDFAVGKMVWMHYYGDIMEGTVVRHDRVDFYPGSGSAYETPNGKSVKYVAKFPNGGYEKWESQTCRGHFFGSKLEVYAEQARFYKQWADDARRDASSRDKIAAAGLKYVEECKIAIECMCISLGIWS